MRRYQSKSVVVLLAAVCAAGMLWPSLAAAYQTTPGEFNQSWLVLGPYFRKDTGNSAAQRRQDYLTDGVIVDRYFVPTSTTVVNTAYPLPICGSFAFVWRTPLPLIGGQRGFDRPTIFRWDDPDDQIDVRGVFGVGSTERIMNSVTYFWAYANNLTAGDVRVRVASHMDDYLHVSVDGIERYEGGGYNSYYPTARYQYYRSGSFYISPGPHLVMVKAFNGGGGYGFRLRMNYASCNTNGVRDTDAVPASIIRWDLTAPGYSVPPPAVPAGQATAYRTINLPYTYTPSQPVKVDVRVTTSSGSPQTVRVREWAPAGWTVQTSPAPTATFGGPPQIVTTTTYGGQAYNGQYLDWNVGVMSPATTNAAQMTYYLLPPPTAQGKAFSTGTVVSDVSRVIGVSGYANREQTLYGANPGVGAFNFWQGTVGINMQGRGSSIGRPSVPPWTSGTLITPDPWYEGKATYNPGANTYSVTGLGSDIWNEYDRCHYTARQVTGDFIFRGDIKWTSCPGLPGQVAAAGRAGTNAKALIMLRSMITAGSPAVWLGNRRYWNSATPAAPQATAYYQFRDRYWTAGVSAGSTDRTTTESGGVIVPTPFKLVRRGTNVGAFHFFGGQWIAHSGGWRDCPELTSPTILACLAVGCVVGTGVQTSYTAEFSNVSITSLPVVSATRSFGFANPLHAPDRFETQPITVRIFLKVNTSTSAKIEDDFPVGWTAANVSNGGTISGTSVTWNLATLSADTTLTYEVTPPTLTPLLPVNFQTPSGAVGYFSDVTNSITFPIAGPRTLQRYRATLYQQGQYPTTAYAGCYDLQVYQWNSGNFNTGWNQFMEEGENSRGINDNKIPIIRFGLDIDPGATVFGATLRIFHDSNRTVIGGPNGTSGTVHRVYAAKINRDWTEGCATGNDGRYANLDEANWWFARMALSNWASGGLRGGALDCDMPESYADLTTNTRATYVTWDVTEMTADWVANPASNYGVKLSQDDQNTTHYPMTWWAINQPSYAGGICDLRSRNHGTANSRPMLIILAYRPPELSATHWELYR